MSKNMRIIFLILTVILCFFLVMIFRFYNDVETAVRTGDIEVSSGNGSYAGLTVFSDSSGLKGIRNENDQIVIPARWSSIIPISSGRFIVSRTDGQVRKFGVIDYSENIIIPVIYSRIVYEQADSFFVCTTENNGFILFNDEGNALIEREWSSYQKKIKDKPLESDGNYIELENGSDVFRLRSRDGRISVMYIKMIRELCGFEKQITIRNVDKNLPLRDTPDFYYQVVDNSISYITSMFERDAVQMGKLISSSDFHGPTSDEVDFTGGELRYFHTIWPFIEYKDGMFSYACKISLMYAVPEIISFDGSFTRSYKIVTFNICMRREQDGYFRIFKVTADEGDISEFDIPPECFDPEEEPENTEITEEKLMPEYPYETNIPYVTSEPVVSVYSMPVTLVSSESSTVFSETVSEVP